MTAPTKTIPKCTHGSPHPIDEKVLSATQQSRIWDHVAKEEMMGRKITATCSGCSLCKK